MNDLLKYAIKRIMLGMLLVVGVSIIIFFTLRLLPGDPIGAMMDEDTMISEVRKAELREKWGLDKPIVAQYFYWIKSIFEGDFGSSITAGRSVAVLLKGRLPYTLRLTITSTIIMALIAVPLGLLAAFKHNKFIDKFLLSSTILLQSMPRYWLGLILMIVFSITLKWFPISGYIGPISMVLPVATLVIPSLGWMLRLTRSETLETYREKYVATAYAKGLRERIVLVKHVLRNSLITVAVLFFLRLPYTIGGSVIVEKIFALPGTGTLLFDSILLQDYPVIQAFVLILSFLTVLFITIGDIVTAILDPRIRKSIKGS
jgi:peptide/nickel transport system permease protein